MFDSLSSKLDGVFKKLGKRGILRPEHVKEGLREIRIALLEADVNYKVVKEFIKRVEVKAVGEEVLKSLTPAQQIVKIVKDELIALMGEGEKIDTTSNPTVVMLMGLQGSGKTTTAAKLAKKFLKEGKKPFLIAADLQRPAAIDQLAQLGKEIGVGVYTDKTTKDVINVVKKGIEEGKRTFSKIIIIDTAGRLHIDEELMEEIKKIKDKFKPQESILVVDSMTGQDAVNVAKGFDEKIGIDGVILTKLDGDARGGAALSLKVVTGKPIKFVGIGEKIDDLEPFYPDRIVSRMLGMGDVLSLIEKAESVISDEEAASLEKKMLNASFTLQDFMDQIKMVKKMGSLGGLLKMLPGVPKGINIDDKELIKVESIIQSMTPEERKKPKIIKASRKRRIAKGCGRTVADVNRLLKQYDMSKNMMKKFGKMGKKKLSGMKNIQDIAGMFKN